MNETKIVLELCAEDRDRVDRLLKLAEDRKHVTRATAEALCDWAKALELSITGRKPAKVPADPAEGAEAHDQAEAPAPAPKPAGEPAEAPAPAEAPTPAQDTAPWETAPAPVSAPAPAAAPAAEETAEERKRLRKIAVALIRAGRREDVKAAISCCGAALIEDVPADRLPALADKLAELQK